MAWGAPLVIWGGGHDLQEEVASAQGESTRSSTVMSSAIIVIPCYNEAARLQVHTFQTFTCAQHALRFLFIDDGSTDDTWQVLEAIHLSNPRHYAIYQLPKNAGKAEAVRQGVLRAFAAGSDYVGYWDADLATPLEAIPAFCDLLDAKLDLLIVFGARVRLLGRTIARRAVRHYLGRVFATAASVVLRVAIYDTQCGAKLFRTSPAVQCLFQQPFVTRWLFDVELLARWLQARRRTPLRPLEEIVYEVPLQEWRDVAGSKVRPSDFLKAFVGLALIYWTYLRSQANPGRDKEPCQGRPRGHDHRCGDAGP
jgi:dolichyl-phosphate beta-glucosyltransferase